MKALKIILISIGVIVGIGVISSVIAFLTIKPEFHVERSIEIDAPAEAGAAQPPEHDIRFIFNFRFTSEGN